MELSLWCLSVGAKLFMQEQLNKYRMCTTQSLEGGIGFGTIIREAIWVYTYGS